MTALLIFAIFLGPIAVAAAVMEILIQLRRARQRSHHRLIVSSWETK